MMLFPRIYLKGGGGSGVTYIDDPNARKRQEEYHRQEMKRLNDQHERQMKGLQNMMEQQTKVLASVLEGQALAEHGYKKKDATLEDTQRIHRLLEKKREEFKPAAVKLEETLHQTADSGFDLVMAEVEQAKANTGISLNSDIIAQKFADYTKKIDGSISEVINRRVALSDPECAAILEKETEDEREAGLKVFMEKAAQESVRNAEDSIEAIMSDAMDMVSHTVINRLSDKQQEAERAATELQSLEGALSSSDVKQKQELYKKQNDALGGFITTIGTVGGTILGGVLGGPVGAGLGAAVGTATGELVGTLAEDAQG